MAALLWTRTDVGGIGGRRRGVEERCKREEERKDDENIELTSIFLEKS